MNQEQAFARAVEVLRENDHGTYTVPTREWNILEIGRSALLTSDRVTE